MHLFQGIDEQVWRSLAKTIAKPLHMEPPDPVENGEPARLEVARLVVLGRQERRYIGLQRPPQRPLRAHVGSIDSELERGALRGLSIFGRRRHRVARTENRGCAERPRHRRL